MSTAEHLSTLHAQGREQRQLTNRVLEQGAVTQHKIAGGISQLSDQAAENQAETRRRFDQADDDRADKYELGAELNTTLAMTLGSHLSSVGGTSFCGIAFALVFCTTDY